MRVMHSSVVTRKSPGRTISHQELVRSARVGQRQDASPGQIVHGQAEAAARGGLFSVGHLFQRIPVEGLEGVAGGQPGEDEDHNRQQKHHQCQEDGAPEKAHGQGESIHLSEGAGGSP